MSAAQGEANSANAGKDNTEETGCLALKKFKFLASKLRVSYLHLTDGSQAPENSVLNQLNCYRADHADRFVCSESDGLQFWMNRRSTYNKLSLIAEDLLSAPASQANVEHIFSLCGLLTGGRRNVHFNHWNCVHF